MSRAPEWVKWLTKDTKVLLKAEPLPLRLLQSSSFVASFHNSNLSGKKIPILDYDNGIQLLVPLRGTFCWHTNSLRQDRPWDYFSYLWLSSLNFFFCLKALGKNEKWHPFCAQAQWGSPRRHQNVGKRHLASSNLTFLLIAIDRNEFRRMKEEGLIYQMLPQIFSFVPRDLFMIFQSLVMILPRFFDFERP